MAEQLVLHDAPEGKRMTLVAKRGDVFAEMVIRGYDPANNGHIPSTMAPTREFQGFADLAVDKYGNGSYLATRDSGPVHLEAVILDEGETLEEVKGDRRSGFTVALASSPDARRMKGFFAATDAPAWAQDADAAYVLNNAADTDNYGRLRRTAGDKFPTSFTKQVVGEMAKRETTILTPAWLAQYGRNPFERQVPTRHGEMVTLPARSMEFFYTPTNEEATRINEVLSSDHPTIFIPTCVPDAFFHAGGASIEYATDKPLTGEIAWTAQNTLDGLRVLLPELAKRGVTPNIVMGMGDYEYYMSATRGMSEEAYRAKVNQSADRIARELQTMIAQTYGEQPAVETHVNLKGGMNSVTVLGGSKLPSVRITGMMELAGGKEKWQALLPQTAQKVRAAIASPDFAKLTTKTREKRRAMTDFWLTLAGNMSPTEDDFLNKFVEDAASYVAFDEVARSLYGANTLVFSGDSRAMEAYAAKIADLPLLSVSGLYKGSEGTE